MKYSILPYESRHIFSWFFDFIQKKKRKINQKKNATIYEHISSTSNSEKMSDFIEYIRKCCKHKKSEPNTDEDKKMECIKFLFFCDIDPGDEDSNPWDDEYKLKWIHLEN